MAEILREVADHLDHDPLVTVSDAGGLAGVLVTLLADSGIQLEKGLEMIREIWPRDNEPS